MRPRPPRPFFSCASTAAPLTAARVFKRVRRVDLTTVSLKRVLEGELDLAGGLRRQNLAELGVIERRKRRPGGRRAKLGAGGGRGHTAQAGGRDGDRHECVWQI